jgi:hypothetical protein
LESTFQASLAHLLVLLLGSLLPFPVVTIRAIKYKNEKLALELYIPLAVRRKGNHALQKKKKEAMARNRDSLHVTYYLEIRWVF